MPPSSSLTPKPPSLLRVSESQAISNSSSFISSTSTSTSSLFDRNSGASSGCLTDISSPITPFTAEFGDREGEVSETQPSDSPTKEQASLPKKWDRYDRALFSPQSRLPRPTNVSLTNRSSRLDRACTLGPRSSARSYSQNGTPFLSLIPTAVRMNEEQRCHPDPEDTFDAVTILRYRLEQGNPTVAARRALEIMDRDGRPPAARLNESVGGAVDAPFTVLITGPDSPVEDWSSDFELDSAGDLEVCPELRPDVNTIVDQLSDSESELDEDWFNAAEIAAAHSSILFPSESDRNLFDEIERDIASSPMPMGSFLVLPSKPVLEPVTSDSPCSPFILGTPDLSANWANTCSSLSTLMAESPALPISSPENVSIDEEELARIIRNVLSFPTRTRQPFSGSPEGDVDVATVMRLEIASTFSANHPHPPASQTRTLIGLGVAMPVIYPPLPPSLFPYHHPPGATLSSRSLRDLGYQTFDDKMFQIEQASLAICSRNVNQASLPENVEADLSGLGFEINESLSYSPLEGCTSPTPLLPEVDFEYSDAFQVEQMLPLGHTPLNRTPPIILGKVLVGLGLDGLTEASVKSQSPSSKPSPTTGRHHLVSADKSVTEMEVALPPVSDFYRQVQNSFNFEPLGAQKSIELDASQLERQSALYKLEHTDLLLDHIFSYSPPLQIEERSEIERQLLARLSEKKSHNSSESQRYIPFSSPVLPLQQDFSDPCTLTTNKFVEVEQPPRSVKQLAVSDGRKIFSKKSYQALKTFGLERLAIFQPRSGRDDLDLTSPTVTPQNDPRSPHQSTLERVFLTFTSINPPSETQSPMTSATTSTALGIEQSFGSARHTDKELVTHPEFEDPSKSSSKNMQIGLGLPSQVALRRSRLSSQGSIEAIRCQSRSYSQECQNPSLVVTEPSFAPVCSRVQSVGSSNQFLKPSHFTQRPLYDIAEVPTPPSSTFSSPRGMISPRNQWSSPFIRLNPPQKKQSSTSYLSTPPTGSPLTTSSIHANIDVVGATNVVPPPEVSMIPTAPARPGFKRFVSKFTRALFKRSRPLKTSELVSSPVLIEHADAPPGLGLLRQDNLGVSYGTKENDLTPSTHKLQLLF